MKNTLYLLFLAPFISFAQDNHKIKVLISNDYAKPVIISHLDDQYKQAKAIVNPKDDMLYAITPDQFLHLKPRFFELNGKAYQVKFSIPSTDKYKIEVTDAIKKPQGITLQGKPKSVQLNRMETLFINIDDQGALSLGKVEKKKLA